MAKLYSGNGGWGGITKNKAALVLIFNYSRPLCQ